jgi:hypothetical protein
MSLDEQELAKTEFSERFGAALETWRFEVNSYWTRTSYFALFQGGALAGLWTVLDKKFLATSAALSLLGVLLTFVWFFNNNRMHEYVEYWWNRAGEIEVEFQIPAERQLVFGYERRRRYQHRIRYSNLIQAVPCLFLCAWFWIFCLSIFKHFRP